MALFQSVFRESLFLFMEIYLPLQLINLMSFFLGKVCENSIPGNVAVKILLLLLSKLINCSESKKNIYLCIVGTDKGMFILHQI